MFFNIDIPNISNNLFPNLTTLVAHLIATGIILFFLVRWVWKPFQKSQEDRNNYIKSQIREAENTKLTITFHEEEIKKNYLRAKLEAEKIITESKQKSAAEVEILMQKTLNEIEQLKLEALADIKQQKQKMQEEQRKEIVNIAFAAAEKIIQKNLNTKDNQKIVDEFLNEIKK